MDQPKYCPRCRANLKVQVLGGRDRLACPDPTCRFVFWDNPTPVVAAVVERDGEVVLVRNRGWPEKIFGLVAGFLERDESPEDGVLREVREEIGLDAHSPSLIGVYSFPEMHQVILAFHVIAEGRVVLGEELAAYRSVPVATLRPWPFGTGLAVKDWLESRGRE